MSPISTKVYLDDNLPKQRKIEDVCVVESRSSYTFPLIHIKNNHDNTKNKDIFMNKYVSEDAQIMDKGSDIKKRTSIIRR
jgi:hypothetical protein